MNIANLCITFGSIMTYVFYIAIAIIVLMIMVTIHEFGHFVAGRKLGFKINEFSVGFGKKLWQKTTKDGILVSVRLIPLGGYCAFDGEDEDIDSPQAFNNQKPWKRLIVLFSGAFFNFLSAVLFSFILLVSFGYSDVVQVRTVNEYSTNITYAVEQIQEDDVIIAVDGVKTEFVNDNYFFTLIQNYEVGEEFTVTVRRDGEVVDVTMQYGRVIEYNSTESAYEINGKLYEVSTILEGNVFEFTNKTDITDIVTTTAFDTENPTTAVVQFSIDGMSFNYSPTTSVVNCLSLGLGLKNYVYTFGEALVECVPFTVEWGWKVLVLLWELITGQLPLSGIGGPITTIGAIASYTQTSWINLLLLFPLISVNLAVFNLLPFPALDGSRMVFVVIEWIRRKPINRNVEGWIHTIGLIVLFGFVIFVDIFNLLF